MNSKKLFFTQIVNLTVQDHLGDFVADYSKIEVDLMGAERRDDGLKMEIRIWPQGKDMMTNLREATLEERYRALKENYQRLMARCEVKTMDARRQQLANRRLLDVISAAPSR